MSDNPTGQPSTSISTPLTYRDFNQQLDSSQNVRRPFDANAPSPISLGGLSTPSDSSQPSFNSRPSHHHLLDWGGVLAGAAVQNSLGPPITSNSSTSLDNASLISSGASLDVLPASATRLSNGSATIKPLNGPNDEPPFLQNQPRHGDLSSRVSPGGSNDSSLAKSSAQQHASSLLLRATAATASPLHPATVTPASNLAPSANGTYRSDASSGSGPTVVNKPVLKMKRTGQNFPLSSSGTGLFQQRNRSYSPSHRQGALPRAATGKASDSVTKDGQEAARVARTEPLGGRSSEKLDAPLKVELQQSLRSTGNSAPNGLLPSPVRPSTKARGGGKSTATIQDSDTDDIIYETVTQTEPFDGAVEDVIDNESSSDDSDSQSDDDDDIVNVDAGEASFRQLFRAPDQEDGVDESEDGSDDDEEDEDDDATSVSSSDGSSNVDEPTVALPSANIQHQEAYPSTIIEMAEPGRLYTECRLDNGTTNKAGPALFPVGYNKYNNKLTPWVCAVRSCRLLYKTPAGLANHARFTHKKAMFNDNMDGTVSLVGSYSKKNQSGHWPPVVVSKRPLDPKEPPMREPTLPFKKYGNKVRSDTKKISESPVFFQNDDDVVMGDGEADTCESQENPPPPPIADPKSSEQMWEYVRPFLSNHNSLPDTNWARHIIHLPRVRDIEWNEARNREHPYKDSHPRDITALIVQVTGVESPTPCVHCDLRRGPFIGCIVLSPDAPRDVQKAVLSCANCYYHCGQSACSLCEAAVARRVRGGRAGQKPDSYNVKLLSDVAHRKSAKAMLNQPQLLSGSVIPLEPPTQPKLKLYQPSEFKSIDHASSERTYKVIKGLNGKDVPMCGALIPEKYDLDRTIPSYPWICPIRSCRRVFKKISSLGPHFARAHSGSLLNDNQDGTLSQIGYYSKSQPGITVLPPLIISKNPLDPKEPPMETPGLPGQGGHAPKVSKHQVVIKNPQGTTQSRQLSTSDATELWDYMRPHLPNLLTSISKDDNALILFHLHRRREVQWRPNMQNVKVEDDRRQILGLLIYLTGEKHRDGEKSCTHCVRRNGPFLGCMILTSGVPKGLRPLVRSCANCVFTHKSSSCSVKSVWGKDADERSQSEAATAKKRVWAAYDESEEPMATRRRSDRLGLADQEDKAKTEEPRKKIVTLSLKRNSQTPGSGGAVEMPMPTSAVSNGGAVKRELSSALIHAGQVQPDELLEMEDWEIAPGRIRGSGADGVNNNIAFSKSYLEANQAVRVSRDVTFEVKSIKSGNNLELEADRAKTRYCTLASGKLYVKVEEQEPFTIGPHGLFKIAPGSAARIQNRLYIDSVLHISTYADG